MTTIDHLQQLIHEQFDIDPAAIDPDVPFADYELDSLTVAELLFSVEDVFHVQIPDRATRLVTTLRGLASMLDELTASKTVGVSSAG